VDAIIETDAGQWAAFEVKLIPASVEAGAASLLKFAAGFTRSSVADLQP